jgi:hypothetical protein
MWSFILHQGSLDMLLWRLGTIQRGGDWKHASVLDAQVPNWHTVTSVAFFCLKQVPVASQIQGMGNRLHFLKGRVTKSLLWIGSVMFPKGPCVKGFVLSLVPLGGGGTFKLRCTFYIRMNIEFLNCWNHHKKRTKKVEKRKTGGWTNSICIKLSV